MEITASEVSRLRAMTGAGMMDCKKALTMAGGDVEKAIEELRKKGQKVSASRSDKEAREGAVFIALSKDHKEAALVALNCETDFVVKNDSFRRLGELAAQAALANKTSVVDQLMQLRQGELTVGDHITDLMGKVGERIEVSRLVYLRGEFIVSYTHLGNKLGILVSMTGATGAAAEEAGRNIGMQIAAMNPMALDEKGLSKELVTKERAIIEEQIRAEGKPENMIAKIAEGKLRKFYQESTLLNQPFVKENKQTVAQYLSSVSPTLKVVEFHRVPIN